MARRDLQQAFWQLGCNSEVPLPLTDCRSLAAVATTMEEGCLVAHLEPKSGARLYCEPTVKRPESLEGFRESIRVAPDTSHPYTQSLAFTQIS